MQAVVAAVFFLALVGQVEQTLATVVHIIR